MYVIMRPIALAVVVSSVVLWAPGVVAAEDSHDMQTYTGDGDSSIAESIVVDLARPAGVKILMTDVGPVLTDDKGMTLYLWGGSGECSHVHAHVDDDFHAFLKVYGEYDAPPCAEQWPPLLAPADAVAIGNWGIRTRDDGSSQWTYEGKGVHRLFKDLMPGDVNGKTTGLSLGNWAWIPLLAPLRLPPGVISRHRKGLGLYAHIVGAGTLYTLDFVPVNKSVAARKWSTRKAGELARDVGVWTVITEADGSKVWGVNGERMYTYSGDHAEGDSLGVVESGAKAVVLHPMPEVPAGITVRRTALGPVYADSNGRTLYVFSCDIRPPGSRESIGGLICDGWDNDLFQREQYCPAADKCAQNWMPFEAPEDAQPSGGIWTVMTIPDPVNYPLRWQPLDSAGELPPGAVNVWLFEGRAVFTSKDDDGPGQLWGHNVHQNSGQRWLAINAGWGEGRPPL